MNIDYINWLKPPCERYYGIKKKNGVDEPNWALIHINIEVPWKCHKATPCVANLNKQKCHFSSSFLMQNWRTGGQNKFCLAGVGGGWYQWEWGGGGKMMKGEYSANTVYTCM
jgi:hypothetical protein